MQGVQPLGEQGTAGSEGQPETGPLPEGAVHEQRQTARDPVSGVGVQALRGKPHPASDLESLDMHAGMDEPELLMQLLVTLAREKANRGGRAEWLIVADAAQEGVDALERANETPRR
jgi:hypothetical protein